MLDPGQIFGTIQPALIIVGGLLLVFGRRLFWVALGVAGFVIGWQLGTELSGMPGAHVAGARLGVEGAETLRLGFAVVFGLVGIVLAFAAQRIAVLLAGIALGGLGVLWLLEPFAADLGGWIWAFAAIGAVAGVVLVGVLFSLALVIVSSWIGAGLVTEGLGPVDAHRLWLFAGLLVVGLLVQGLGGGPRRRRARRVRA